MSEPNRPDFLEVYAIWRNEGLTPLSMIQGYADLLAIGALGPLPLTDPQRQALDIIRQSCRQAIQCWYFLSDYLDIHYNQRSPEALTVVSLLDEVTARVQPSIGAVTITLPDQLPAIWGNRNHLILAFCNLLYPIDRRLDIGNDQSRIHIYVPESHRVGIELISGLQVPIDDRWLWHPGTCVGLAATVLQQHGSQIQAQSHAAGIAYHFTLPIVSDEADGLQMP